MSFAEDLSSRYGWPLKIHARGYDAYLTDVQPLLDGEVAPIYRFPGGETIVSESELLESRQYYKEQKTIG